jgi:transposase
LHKIRRQDPARDRDKHERAQIRGYRKAVEVAAKGELSESFERLDKMGAVVACGLGEQADKLAGEYVRLAEQKASAVVVSQTWDEVRRVNASVRDELKAKGLLGAKDTAIQVLDKLDLTKAQKRDERFYHSVQRFVRQLLQTQPVPFVRMEVEPGMEAQVDFGQGAWVMVGGKRKRPHLFRTVLSHSRKDYSEVVWQQTTESFIRCLENAFRSFGGVPRTLIIDNLRAAVTRADWYDPELNAKVAEFCRHYGTVMLPTRPAMPQHKGKIEAGVKFAQNNALKGRCFESLAAQNLFLAEWESGVADTRIHGTTRQQVGKVFNEVERAHLLPLPAGLFPVFEEAPRAVHGDGYVELKRAYYSVPPEHVGRQVWVRWESRLLRVINQRREVIAVHALAEPGKFTTDPTHLNSPYRRVVQESLEHLLDRARLIGPQTGSWAQSMVQQRGPIGTRVLHGLLALAQKHPVKALEQASQQALHHGTWRLRDLRTLLEQAIPLPQLDFLETHPLIRNLDTYRDCVPDCFTTATINQT